jgi:hypothetical protein
MAYNTIIMMAGSPSLISRIAAAAAGEGSEDPVGWANTHIWAMATQPGWAEAWQYAVDESNINVNPDTGQRDDVISDGMILSGVQQVMAEEATPPPEPPAEEPQ